MRHAILAGLVAATMAWAGPASAADKPILGTWGVETQHLSKTVKPGDDFYVFVNEGWLKTAKPPPGLAYANAFVDAYLRTQGQLRTLVGGILASAPPPGSDEAKIAALYRSYVDTDRRNALGLTPLAADRAAIDAAATREDIARLMGRAILKSPVSIGIDVDARDPKRYVVTLGQSGLGLPARDYYLATGEPYAGHRTAYLAHVADVLRRAGIGDAADKARAIVAFETRLAEVHWTPAEKRDPVRGYHAMSMAELEAYAPGIAWPVVFATIGLGQPAKIVLETDEPVQRTARILAETPVETMRDYLTFHLINDMSPLLSREWDDANFAFFGTRLGGIPQQQPVPDRALAFLAQNYGEILGRVYVKSYFPASHRDQMQKLVANLRAALRKRLEANDWMDEPTRKAALVKLDAIVSHIGYPDRYRDWSAVAFDPGDLVGNRRAIVAFEVKDAIGKLGEARRDWQWSYPATEVNAGYSPSLNSISFPAGILQSPFFDPNADPAVNYGSIGAVIGHELGHAFDDQGSQQDENGALRNWWTPASRAQFEKRTALLVEQFNGFEALPGLKVNGRLTLGENIGDLGGVTIALDAYRMFVASEQGGQAPVIDGFTGEQRFFLSWGQLWRDFTTPDTLRANVLGDPHSPNPFRVRGPLPNVDAWYVAFDVKPGDVMYLPPERRAKIW